MHSSTDKLTLIVLCQLAIWLLTAGAQTHSPAESEQKARTESYLVEKGLDAGNLDVLNPLTRPEDLPVLYSMLRLTLTHQFGDRSTAVRIAVASKIATIPGHAEYIAEKVESLSTEMYTARRRERLFYSLQHVKSSESLEVLGRFIFDDRLAEAKVPREALDLSLPITPNAPIAADSLARFLGVYSPITPGGFQLHETEVKKMREWWGSPEGAKFRKEYAADWSEKLAAADAKRPAPVDKSPKAESELKKTDAATSTMPLNWPLLGAIIAFIAAGALMWKFRKA